MNPNTPMTLAAAVYKTRPDAVEAFETIWGARHQGEYDHMALMVLTKDEDGQIQVERHFWNQIPRDDIQALSELVDSGQSAVFVVTVNPKQTDIAPLLMHPERSRVIQTKAGDWGCRCRAGDQAGREGHGCANALDNEAP